MRGDLWIYRPRHKVIDHGFVMKAVSAIRMYLSVFLDRVSGTTTIDKAANPMCLEL